MQAFCNYHIKYKHTRWGGEYIKQYKLVVMKQLLRTSGPSAFFSRGNITRFSYIFQKKFYACINISVCMSLKNTDGNTLYT